MRTDRSRLWLGLNGDIAIDGSTASKSPVIGFRFEQELLSGSATVSAIVHTFFNSDETSSALATTSTVAEFAAKCVHVDAVR